MVKSESEQSAEHGHDSTVHDYDSTVHDLPARIAALELALQPLAEFNAVDDEFGLHCPFCTWSDSSYSATPVHDDNCPIIVAKTLLPWYLK